MTSQPLLQPRIRTLRALILGISLGFAGPVFADSLPDIQRMIKQGQHAQALEKVESYLSNRPKDAQGRFMKGLILTEMNRSADAISVFTRLSEDYPELPEPYNNLAVLYAQQKQYDKARTALEMAIRTHPSYAIAYENLGDIYSKLASQAYDKALQFDGTNSATKSKLALIHNLITTSSKNDSKPAPSAPAAKPVPPVAVAPTQGPAAAPVAAAPAPAPIKPAAPSATIVATTPGGTIAAASEAKPAAAPSSPPAKSAPTPNAASDDVVKAIAAWANAWSRKDMRAYLAAYASDFNVPGGGNRKAWEKEREQRIGNRTGKISVSYDEPSISINGDRATARFKQHYKAPGISSSSNKTLVFVRTGNKWLIKEENAR